MQATGSPVRLPCWPSRACWPPRPPPPFSPMWLALSLLYPARLGCALAESAEEGRTKVEDAWVFWGPQSVASRVATLAATSHIRYIYCTLHICVHIRIQSTYAYTYMYLTGLTVCDAVRSTVSFLLRQKNHCTALLDVVGPAWVVKSQKSSICCCTFDSVGRARLSKQADHIPAVEKCKEKKWLHQQSLVARTSSYYTDRRTERARY